MTYMRATLIISMDPTIGVLGASDYELSRVSQNVVIRKMLA
jgi:hypothetical protein